MVDAGVGSAHPVRPIPKGTISVAMTIVRHDYRLQFDDPAEDAVDAVVHRLAAAFQHVTERYDGVRVHRGCVVLGGTIESRLVTVQCGGIDDDQLGVRFLVSGVAGARAAVIAFPATLFACLVIGSQVGPDRMGLLFGLILGLPIAAAASYAVYRAAQRGAFGGSRDGVGGDRIALDLARRTRDALEPLGMRVEREAVRLHGLDNDDAAPPLAGAFQHAVRSIAERS